MTLIVPITGAANRFPDSCSSDPTGAAALNVQSTRSLAAQAQKRGIVLIYISTDYVFSGKQGEAPYKTDDRPSPPNIYGQTKYEGEMAVLSEMGLQAQRDGSQEAAAGASRTLGVSLRVPLLYGHVDEGDKSESAVHPLLHAVHKAAALKEGEPKVKADHYSLRYPTATEDVARVCVDVAKLYLEPGDKELPHILHFSAQDKYTKYEMCKLFGEILGLSIDNVEPDDPTKGMGAESSGSQRPYNTNLDVSALKKLGVDVSTANFEAWWLVFLFFFNPFLCPSYAAYLVSRAVVVECGEDPR